MPFNSDACKLTNEPFRRAQWFWHRAIGFGTRNNKDPVFVMKTEHELEVCNLQKALPFVFTNLVKNKQNKKNTNQQAHFQKSWINKSMIIAANLRKAVI